MNKLLAPIVAATMLSAIGSFDSVQAGIIQVGEQYEYKGTFIITEPATLLIPSELQIICPICGVLATIPNLEEVDVDVVVGAIDFYNVYPLFIDVPQPIGKLASVDFFSILAADLGTGIGSLPDRVTLASASMTGVGTGTRYESEITFIDDLAALPTSSSNNLNIQWDLSVFSETTGNFFLAKTTVPFFDVCCVPEPSAILSLLAIGTLGATSTLKRKLKPSQSTKKATTKVG